MLAAHCLSGLENLGSFCFSTKLVFPKRTECMKHSQGNTNFKWCFCRDKFVLLKYSFFSYDRLLLLMLTTIPCIYSTHASQHYLRQSTYKYDRWSLLHCIQHPHTNIKTNKKTTQLCPRGTNRSVTTHVFWSSLRPKFCLCWQIQIFCALEPNPTTTGRLNLWIKTVVPVRTKFGGDFRNILLFHWQLSHQLATERLRWGNLQVIVAVQLQHVLQQGNTVDLAKLERSVYKTIFWTCPHCLRK